MDYHKIIEIAESKNINLNQLAERVGVTRAGLVKSIANKSLRIDTLEKISQVLGTPIYIFFNDEESSYYPINRLEMKNVVKLLKDVHEYLRFNYDSFRDLNNLFMDIIIQISRNPATRDNMAGLIDKISEWKESNEQYDQLSLIETCWQEQVKHWDALEN